MPSLLFSVVVCTYNPRSDYIERVLANLHAQTFTLDRWELLLVDNGSNPRLQAKLTGANSLSYRIVREETPGLVAARIRGLNETSGGWLVYVDDDNLLNQNYLEELNQLILSHSNIALWSGQIRPEFEIQPSEQLRPFFALNAIIELQNC